MKVYILGAGITGLAAGFVSGLPVYEAQETPGGICSSYYMKPKTEERLHNIPNDQEAYRFEIGGGHWIFGGDPLVLHFIKTLTPVKSYVRRSAVYFSDKNLLVPYPIDNNLRYFGTELATKILEELVEASKTSKKLTTMAEWLESHFGPTLYKLYFEPFHELYTAGLFRKIAPQDPYKTPINLKLAIQGVFAETPPVGYNVTFIYPKEGLNSFIQKMASYCNIHYNKKVVRIDLEQKIVYFEDNSNIEYDYLISTLPLNHVVEMTKLDVDEKTDPATSLLVINIGAIKGSHCPDAHWVYIPKSKSGFHRVGFYSNVDTSFLPLSVRKSNTHVSIYVEKAYIYGNKPSRDEVIRISHEVIDELIEWDWIKDVDIVDPTWIDVAYTWSWPNSHWREKALKMLESYGIFQVGRYARWTFQGIAESIKEGFIAGSSFSHYK
ncbi:MAG: protoporphyrinogen/coproporphyrinogen oxidase [Thermoprotei archaeon]|jgi:protoporphyrinogen oxidase